MASGQLLPDEADFARRRDALCDRRGVRYRDFKRTLTPRYGLVWLDIVSGYAALVAITAVLAAALPVGPAAGVGLAVMGGLLYGYALFYLLGFLHEATHFLIAPGHRWNDRLANLFIGTLFGQDVKAYRLIHFDHHRYLGTPRDTERTYFDALDLRFILGALTGLKVLRIFRRRDGSIQTGYAAGRTGGLKRYVSLHLLGGLAINGAFVAGAVALGAWPVAAAWVFGMFGVMPCFGAVRQLLEHRSEDARDEVDYARVPHGAVSRSFGAGPFASTFGSAGFNRHLLHHWEPQVSYTRLKELEAFLLDTELAAAVRRRQTTYTGTFRRLFRWSRGTRPAPMVAANDPADRRPACLVCGSTDGKVWAKSADLEYHTTPDAYTFYRCRHCRALFIDPVPRDRLAQIYPPNYYSFAAPKQSLLTGVKQYLDRQLFARLLQRLPGERLSVLDVGGGSGWLLDVVRPLDSRIVHTQVIDLDPEAEAVARSRGHDYFRGTVEQFHTDRRYDLVLLLNLIEHVPDPVAVLRKVRDLLSPGGVALVKTPNYRSLDAKLFRHADWGGYHCPRHWVLFDRDGFTAAARRAGLACREFAYTQGGPFWAQSLLAALSRRGLVKVTPARPSFYHPLFPVLSAAFAGLDLIRSRCGARTSQMFFVLGIDG